MTTTTMPIGSGDAPLDLADMRRRIKAIFIGSVGNLVEWYDFYAYAAFALYFAAAFFPNSDPVVQQLNAALLFAAGFLVRPLGGWLFGYLADHYGRRDALMLSVSLMCFGSLMIAVTPTYASIGIGAPILLGARAHHSGLEPRRRIRDQRDLPHRDGRRTPSRLLFELPIRHADRRPVLRADRAAVAAEGVSDRRGDPCLGLAHSLRYRRAAGRHRRS